MVSRGVIQFQKQKQILNKAESMNDTECVDDVERTVCDSLNEKGQSPWTSDGRDRFLAFSSIFENRAESGDSASFIHSKY